MTGVGGMFSTPRALESREIEEIIARFATTARLSIEAGFTGVQVHGAHGYLVSQFLSPRSNRREDAWGGDATRRMRFLLEVVRAIRAEVGASIPVGVKLNSADFQRGGLTEEESMAVVEALETEGVDLLEISGGTYEAAAMVGVLKESTRSREAYFLDYAEAVRERTAMPLMLTGGLRSTAVMEETVATGAVDVIGLGRPLAVETDLCARILDGSTDMSTAQPRRVPVQQLARDERDRLVHRPAVAHRRRRRARAGPLAVDRPGAVRRREHPRHRHARAEALRRPRSEHVDDR